MGQEKLLTVRDVSIALGVSEREVLDLAETGQMPAYKVGGVYLRFKKEQVEDFRKTFKHSDQQGVKKEYPLGEKLSDFFYFNDFYILAALIIILVLIFIFKGY